MKLKKIASLVLAGIMAVSMLTACDTTSAGDDDTVVPPAEDTTPVGYSATILAGVASDEASVMTSEDSAMLAAAVEAAGTAINDSAEIHEMLKVSDNIAYGHQVFRSTNKVTHAVVDLYVDNLAQDVESNYKYNGLSLPVASSGTQRYAGLYVFNRAMNDTQLNNAVANIVSGIMDDQKDHVNATEIDYTLSVAKTDVGTEANGVVLVGIMITRSYTHAA